MSHAFISYNQTDGDFAALMMMQLERAGIDTWMDKERLRPGQEWSGEIDQGILDSFALVLIMSPAAKASEYVTYEWSFALGAGIPILPVLFRPTELHPRLARIQYVNFTQPIRPWDNLIRELEIVREGVNQILRIPRETPGYIRRAVQDIDSPIALERASAIQILASSEHPLAREALRRAMQHPVADVRRNAAYHAADADPALAASILVEDLGTDHYDHDHHHRYYDHSKAETAMRHLTRLGKTAVGPLTNVLQTSDNFIARSWAATALKKIGDREAIPPLMDALRSQPSTPRELSEIVDALLALGAQDMGPELLKLIPTARDFLLRELLVRTLIQIGDPVDIQKAQELASASWENHSLYFERVGRGIRPK